MSVPLTIRNSPTLVKIFDLLCLTRTLIVLLRPTCIPLMISATGSISNACVDAGATVLNTVSIW
jgi:hypothetical protein